MHTNSDFDVPYIKIDQNFFWIRPSRETFVNPPPILISYDEVHHLEEEFVVIPPAMPNLLQDNVEKSEDDETENENLIASCENSKPSTITPAEHESKGNAHDVKHRR